MYKCKGCDWKGKTPDLNCMDKWGIVIGSEGTTCPKCGNEAVKEGSK